MALSRSAERMKHLSLGLLLLSILGCATVHDLRSEPPTLTLKSAKLISEISPCIVEAWLSLSTSIASYDVRTLPRANGGATIILGNPANSIPIAFVDLDRVSDTNETRVGYYAQRTPTVGKFIEAQANTVRQCTN